MTPDTQPEWQVAELRKKTRCKIFLGFTSNLVSAGTREQLKYLAKHSMVDVIVSSAGGIEEDFIKARPFLMKKIEHSRLDSLACFSEFVLSLCAIFLMLGYEFQTET